MVEIHGRQQTEVEKKETLVSTEIIEMLTLYGRWYHNSIYRTVGWAHIPRESNCSVLF